MHELDGLTTPHSAGHCHSDNVVAAESKLNLTDAWGAPVNVAEPENNNNTLNGHRSFQVLTLHKEYVDSDCYTWIVQKGTHYYIMTCFLLLLSNRIQASPNPSSWLFARTVSTTLSVATRPSQMSFLPVGKS